MATFGSKNRKFVTEAANTLGHVVLGALACYIVFPTACWYVLVLFLAGFAACREHIQQLRHHPGNEGMFLVDVAGWVAGAFVYVLLRKFAGLDADAPLQTTV